MPNLNPNSTTYRHSYEPNTHDLTLAMAYDPYGKPVLRIDDTTKQHTSTNRVKMSSQEIGFFNTFQYNKDPQVWDEQFTGTASADFNQFLGGVEMTVGTTAGDQAITQTRNVMRYYPGRQNELVFTVSLAEPTAGIRRRMGIFDELDGMFFEDVGGEYFVVIRRNTVDGPVETRIPRSDWNFDRLDGTGPSGISLDLTKIQMMVIEYEWYGAGQVEFKFVIDNNSFPIHRFNHGNVISETYMTTPFLPVRFELTNVTGEAGPAILFQGSAALRVEGTVSPLGREENVSTPLTGVTVPTLNTFRPVLSVRLRPDRLQGVAIPKSFQAATLDNTGLFYRIVRNNTLTGALFQNAEASSFIEFDFAATDSTGGETLQTGFISPNNQGNVFAFPENAILQLARNNLGTTAENFTILCATTQSNKDVFASLSWIEVR